MANSKPSPKPVALMGYILIFITFGVFGSWAAVAKLDSAVVAPATISLEGNRRVVQHFEGGIVEEILVTEAGTVTQGDVLVRLSSIEARSNLEVFSTRLDVARLVEARLLAERALEDAVVFPEDVLSRNSQSVSSVLADQKDLFSDRRLILKSQEDILLARVEQIKVQIEGLEIQKGAFERRIANYTEMLVRMRDGETRGLIQGNQLSQREDELIEIEANLGQVISDIAQARASIGETELQALQLKQEYRERASTELEQVRAEISELMERRKVADDVLDRTEIRAPGSGTIQNLKVHTVGSVIRPGEVLMELVPEDEELIVNARVSPIDVDNVAVGLMTEVRFTAFKTKLIPIMLGTVDTVSGDVITPDNANEQPYYLARITVDENDIPAEIKDRLSAGMPADVVITTGERTVIDFIASPLMDAVRKSMIEE
ncbi:HlyD family type I secretion periplasmic adaptor subunit [Sulfitobacter geojensis]|uniref:Membrane fusion protein (MFP) family protein n=3 Tax=Sulfitobacter geojensis TaxID=1342299 RepID=A0AAE2W2E0_9RHOB|nr:HlyD family type I secretion periplasmic adaptor subunit [Sulfitobacter geojensis]MBM1695621.1 HlyD family type I secretion periplasmic adaptor subunit [Sulfitobacter geojensis]MBM1707799.1 HlyD family type I secretion periplasmic adaptor subunit [Sulfitobacter geojensis]MBM1715914.1 HlyD family type I secretion periplasmic adaptor subunit [Sulfitobacter geojensis]MBM1719974.1 HlyD family type I secretion periplasmic adaptor subunit [Sulfitobacter geojensis]MBM1724038.1 HlyD family type I s